MKLKTILVSAILIPTALFAQKKDTFPPPQPDVYPFSLTNDGTRGIFGDDDRKEIKDANGYKGFARATAVMVTTANIKDGTHVHGPKLRDQLSAILKTDKFDKNVKYLEQPLCGSCTGFLIGPDILVTAGHCVKDMEKGKTITWIFDYTSDLYLHDSYKYTWDYVVVPKSNQYKVKEIISSKYNKSDLYGDDYCVLRLDREVPRDPYLFRISNEAVPKFTNVYMIGSPSGLPLKFAENAFVINNKPSNYFTNNLDGFQGNSGGPVFNSTGWIEGIHVRGLLKKTAKSFSDYYVDPTCNCIKAGQFSNYSGGQDAQKITTLPFNDLVMAIYDNISYGIRKNDDKRVKKWLAYNGILNHDYTKKRGSLIMLAAKKNNWNALKMMLDQSKKYNEKDANNKDLIYYAVVNQNEDMLKYLLKNGASPNSVSYTGTALHMAVKNNYYSIAKLLIDMGAKLDLKDDKGNTPLHLAAKYGRRTIAELLVKKGASYYSTNKKGYTPRKVAKKSKNKSLSKWLKRVEKGKV